MIKISTVGLDIAKHVFQVHGIDDAGKIVIRRKVRRSELLTFFAQLEPTLRGASKHVRPRIIGLVN